MNYDEFNEQFARIDALKQNFFKAQKRYFIFIFLLEIFIVSISFIFANDTTRYVLYIILILIFFTLHYYQKTYRNFLKKIYYMQNDLIDSKNSVIKVHNSYRCKELFKSNSKNSLNKHPAIIVLDVFGFDDANNSLNYKFNKEFVMAFGYILLDVSISYSTPPFIGHYSDTKFLVYFEDTFSDDETETCLNKLNSFVENFNKNETNFQLYYFKGCAYIPKDSDEQLTSKQLFDKANQAIE